MTGSVDGDRASGPLPRTGSDVGQLYAVGVALVGVGILLVLRANVRRRSFGR